MLVAVLDPHDPVAQFAGCGGQVASSRSTVPLGTESASDVGHGDRPAGSTGPWESSPQHGPVAPAPGPCRAMFGLLAIIGR